MSNRWVWHRLNELVPEGKQTEKFLVTNEFCDKWRVKMCEGDYTDLAKAEYTLCPAPERWEQIPVELSPDRATLSVMVLQGQRFASPMHFGLPSDYRFVEVPKIERKLKNVEP